MSDLTDRIRAAQIDAGERVVMEDLKAKGLLPLVDEVRKHEALEICHLECCGIACEGDHCARCGPDV